MGIIEKLGIEPIKRYCPGDGKNHPIFMCGEKKVREVEQQRNEMLEALINARKYTEALLKDKYNSKRSVKLPPTDRAIEKITGKSWQQIKEIIKS